MQCAQLFQKIDQLNEVYLNIWADLCNIESPTDYKEGVDAVGQYLIEFANRHNWNVARCPQTVSGDAISITMNPEVKTSPVAVSGHMDTVHPVGSFGTPAVRRDAEYIYGPGVEDCKGGIVAALLAMDALEQLDYRERPIKLILQSDEEVSSATSKLETVRFMCEQAKDAVAFLNLEGYKTGTAILTRKGIVRYRFTVTGKAVHASQCYEGANAIAEAAYKIIELEKMKNPNGLTCNCGVIEGGTKANSVPEVCTFLADIRFSNANELETARQTIKTVAETVFVSGCSCHAEEISLRAAMPKSAKNDALLDCMNRIYTENGLPVLEAQSGKGGSDAAYTTEYGIPTVDSLGAEGDFIHSTRERARLASLAEAAKRIASVIYCI